MSALDHELLARMPKIRGRIAYVFASDDFDIDQIIGVKNIRIQDLDELCAVAMQDFDPGFAEAVKPGDVLVGGENFGFGHPHSPPMRAMRHMGIAAVIAESFAPTYYRGETAMGFPQIICPGIRSFVTRWQTVEVDWASAMLRNVDTGERRPIQMPSAAECAILAAGGHKSYLQNELARAGAGLPVR